MVRRRLLSGSTWTIAGKMLIAFSGLASNVLLARLLTPQELGAYFLAYSIVSFGAMLGSLGLANAVVRFIAEAMGLNLFGRARHVIGIVIVLGTLGALGTGLAYLLFGGALAGKLFHSPALAAITGLLAGWIAISVVQGLVGEIFRGFHDIRLATILGGQVTGTVTGVATVGILTVAYCLIWLIVGEASLATVVLLAIGSGSVTTLMAGWILAHKVAKLSINKPQARLVTNSRIVLADIFSVAWPLLVTNLVLFALRNGDIWMLGAFLSQDKVALYGAAIRLVSMVTMPLIMVNAIVPPLIAEMYSQGRRIELERALRSVALVTGIPAFLASMGCILFAGPILGLVYGNFYREGATILALMSAGLLTQVWTGSCGLTLQMTGYQHIMMTVSVATSIVTLSVMLAVVGPYGIVGVAVARFIGVTIQNITIWLVAKHKTGIWTHAGFGHLSWLIRSAS